MKILNSRNIPVYLIFLIGMGISLVGYNFALNWEEERINASFNSDAKEIISAVIKEIEFDLESLESIKSFYLASTNVDRAEFKEFTGHILERHQSIQALEWIPRIKNEERAEYAEMAKADGFVDFEILEKNAKGLMVKADQRAEYYPVYYVEPMKGNERAFGFDLASNQSRLESLQKARDLGRMVATEKIKLVQEKEGQYGFLVFDPIYRYGTNLSTVEQRQENLLGFVLGVFRAEDIVQNALYTINNKDIDVVLLDEEVAQEDQTLYSFEFREESSRENRDSNGIARKKAQKALSIEQPFKVGERMWRIRCIASKGYEERVNTGQSLILLVIGVLTTLIFTGYLNSKVKESVRIKRLVEKRTRDLELGKKAIEDQKFALDQHSIVAITDVSGKISYVNDKFCEISKYSQKELIGQDHRIINSGHHPKEFIADLWKTIANGKVWKGEIKNKAKDGSFYWVDTTITPFLNEKGRPTQYLAIRTDISDRKEDEIRLKKLTEDLLRSNRDLEQFAYVASHDLQEPLRMVASFTQLLEKRYGEKLDDKAKEYIGYAVDGSKRMQALIDDLLRFSRIGRKDIEAKQVDLNKVLDRITADLKLLIKENDARIEYKSLPVVLADESQMTHLFQNFITNAIKFKRGNPTVKIEHRQNNDEHQFTVSDNGIGIEKKYLDRIFVIFQRLHTREEFEGTGIGLAVCKKIIENYGGNISVESEVNEGTTFRFTLNKGEQS
jgi:PAS domain S-box-containing protein